MIRLSIYWRQDSEGQNGWKLAPLRYWGGGTCRRLFSFAAGARKDCAEAWSGDMIFRYNTGTFGKYAKSIRLPLAAKSSEER